MLTGGGKVAHNAEKVVDGNRAAVSAGETIIIVGAGKNANVGSRPIAYIIKYKRCSLMTIQVLLVALLL